MPTRIHTGLGYILLIFSFSPFPPLLFPVGSDKDNNLWSNDDGKEQHYTEALQCIMRT